MKLELTPSLVHSIVDTTILETKVDCQHEFDDDLIRIRRGTANDARKIHQLLLLDVHRAGANTTPIDSIATYGLDDEYYNDGFSSFQPVFILIEEQSDGSRWDICSLAQWSFGYSTWKGRVMNLNTLASGKYEKLIMKVLIKIAKELNCMRIVHQKLGHTSADLFCELHNAVKLDDWLTLELNTDGMTSFLTKMKWEQGSPSCSAKEVSKTDARFMSFSQTIPNVIDHALSIGNDFLKSKTEANGNAIRLRRATTASDAKHILNLVKGLAEFEHAADEVSVTAPIYQRDGCGSQHPMFYCILVESSFLGDSSSVGSWKNVVGMGLFYFGYDASTGGTYLYLEDLYIEKDHRGVGCGTCIMSCLADISLKTNCVRLVWQALEWNAPAIKFYTDTIGANVCKDLWTVRLNHDRIHRPE